MNKITRRMILFALIIRVLFLAGQQTPKEITIASKKFTENIILGEIVSQYLSDVGHVTNHKRELGGTRVLWNALLRGDIQLYPDYTGTVINEILPKMEIGDFHSFEIVLKTFGLKATPPLGFNNSYALGVKKKLAAKYQLNKISDLLKYPQLEFGFTNEFMDRKDGWPGLKNYYHLPQQNVVGLDHDLAYRGLENDDFQVIDLYSTDAEIKYYNLRSLRDDKHFFPRYDAIYIYREDLVKSYPDIENRLNELAGKFNEATMIAMNAAVKIDKKPESQVASAFLKKHLAIDSNIAEDDILEQLYKHTGEHLYLVLISLFAALLLAIPLGIISAKFDRAGMMILAIVGIFQTIPSLALLVFMIPLVGIGGPPAIIALFLYSLLPIVRNTYAGLRDIPTGIRESAIALGLPAFFILRRIELPLALRSILAGIKTSAVINIGTATLGALIGAGGYGQPILTGIRLDDIGLILQGALPAAVLAIMAQLFFDLFEKKVLPKNLK